MKLGSAVRGEAPTISVVAEVQVYDYAVTVVVPSDTSCAGQNVSGGRARSVRLSVRSTGTGKGMHVVEPPTPALGMGWAAGDAADDPTAGWQSGAERPKNGIAERPTGANSFS